MNKSEIAERAAREIHEITFQNLKAQAQSRGIPAKHENCGPKIAIIQKVVERAIAESQAPPKWNCPEMDAMCANCERSYGQHFKDFCTSDRKGTKFAELGDGEPSPPQPECGEVLRTSGRDFICNLPIFHTGGHQCTGPGSEVRWAGAAQEVSPPSPEPNAVDWLKARGWSNQYLSKDGWKNKHRLADLLTEFRAEGDTRELKAAANKLIDYCIAHDWGMMPEPYDSINPLLKLLGRFTERK